MASWRLREAVKETLISNSNGEFDEGTHIVIAGLPNTHNKDMRETKAFLKIQTFGVIKEDINLPKSGSFKKGDRPTATVWSANPRYDLLTEGTYAVVEMLQGKHWVPVYDDDDFSLFFKWNVDTGSLYGTATIEGEIPRDANSGVHRLRHFGSAKETKDSPNTCFTGASSGFAVS
ncbi:hypothetical protein DVH24_013060 [Malus domestica]|uniref:Neutral/alkaline non-lysosomal ceramidase C-terminal domain-containing protein n=1 Tax=Malus domestica TaxID=3750 RepID=A0A498HPJ1_MALDO|nr:hypothetical protein DVH24_013060 [Malus domestica]